MCRRGRGKWSRVQWVNSCAEGAGRGTTADFISLGEMEGDDEDEQGSLVLKCGFSMFCLLTPTASYNAETMEAALLLWASILGMPRVLVTDGGLTSTMQWSVV